MATAKQDEGRRERKRPFTHGKNNRAEWIEGFTLRLTAEEKQDVIAELEEEDVDVLDFLKEMGLHGVKTSVSYDRKADGYTVTIFRNDPEFPDAGYTLTARGRTIERCTQSLLFAIREVSDFNIVEIAEARQALEVEF
jgi:hypothetical protein